MTTAQNDVCFPLGPAGVYAPQEDSQLLVDTTWQSGVVAGRRVADLCTGSGVVAIAAAAAGAASVRAFDICSRAVHCARTNAAAAGADVQVHLGPWTRAAEFGPYDVVVCNPPYVPFGGFDAREIPASAGPPLAWNAGSDGRAVLDPVCAAVPGLVTSGGTVLLVHSEFSGEERTVQLLEDAGLVTEVVARQRIPFGPVLSSRARWLERTGLLDAGRRVEELMVIRADRQ